MPAICQDLTAVCDELDQIVVKYCSFGLHYFRLELLGAAAS
jgi:uncharacterized protein YutD